MMYTFFVRPGVNFLVWDVGGQEKLRPLWKSYTRCTDGIIFVVDSCDTERLEEAKMELTRTARSPDNAGVPILILANKQDLPGMIYYEYYIVQRASKFNSEGKGDILEGGNINWSQAKSFL